VRAGSNSGTEFRNQTEFLGIPGNFGADGISTIPKLVEFDRGRLGLLLSAVIEFWELGGTNSGGGTGFAMLNIAE
jgi:hypothetical protein